MGYQLQQDETLPQGMRRIAREQIAGAQSGLAPVAPDAEAVHDARKRMKKLRGLLRMLRPALSKRYRQENTRFRDIARQLSDVRDADVLIETFAMVAGAGKEQLPAPAVQRVENYLQQHRSRMRAGGGRLTHCLPVVRQSLEEALAGVERWPLEEGGFALIAPGLKHTCRNVRRQYEKTLNAPSVAPFHAWRKQVKYHWYHLRILQPCRPKELGEHAAALKQLSDTIGTEHDLAVLRQLLQSIAGTVIAQEECLDIMEILVEEQQGQRQAAWQLAARLPAETPEALVGRLQDYWQSWNRA